MLTVFKSSNRFATNYQNHLFNGDHVQTIELSERGLSVRFNSGSSFFFTNDEMFEATVEQVKPEKMSEHFQDMKLSALISCYGNEVHLLSDSFDITFGSPSGYNEANIYYFTYDDGVLTFHVYEYTPQFPYDFVHVMSVDVEGNVKVEELIRCNEYGERI